MITNLHLITDPSIYAQLRFSKISLLEAVRTKLYLDSVNKPSIGIGFNLTDQTVRNQVLAAMEINVGLLSSTDIAARVAEQGYIDQIRAAVGISFAQGQGDTLRLILNGIMFNRSHDPALQAYSHITSRSTFEMTMPQMQTTFNALIPNYETIVNSWLPGIDNSNERLALVSLAYNNLVGFNADGTFKSPKLRQAILDDDRAEAWYQIRYQSNGGASQGRGIANRRYQEADLFGLYGSGSLSDLESKEVIRMFTKYRDLSFEEGGIRAYEARFRPSDPNAGSQIIDARILPARNHLTTNFAEGQPIDGDVLVGQDDPNGSDGLIGTVSNDLLFGEKGNDVIAGREGNDVLYGGEGHDLFLYNSGDGQDLILDSALSQGDGKGAVIYDSHLLAGGLHHTTDADNTFTSLDGQFTFVRSGSDLIVNDTLRIKDWQDGELGITLTNAPDIVADLGSTRTVFLKVDHFVQVGTDPNGNPIFEPVFANFFDDASNDTRTTSDPGRLTPPIGNDNNVIHAGGGNDFIASGAGNDQLFGEAGADTLSAAGGSDTVSGDDGDDTLYGVAGNDSLTGGVGNDQLYGDGTTTAEFDPTKAGPDLLDGGAGNDFLTGDGGSDVLTGGEGSDTLWGDYGGLTTIHGGLTLALLSQGGNDFLDGGDGNDGVGGGPGDDVLIGGSGNDFLIGDYPAVQAGFPLEARSAIGGDDVLDGGLGNDELAGGPGSDTLIGGEGDDVLFGEDGFGVTTSPGDDLLDGGQGNDTLAGDGGNDVLFGSTGNDKLFGDDPNKPDLPGGNDFLDGGEGNDQLSGQGGDDVLDGGSGDDELRGDNFLTPGPFGTTTEIAPTNPGNDVLDGEAGNDQLIGNRGDDTLFGGTGDDLLYGENAKDPNLSGNDVLDGGEGDDQLFGGGGDDVLSGDEDNDLLMGDDLFVPLVFGEIQFTASNAPGSDSLDGGAGVDRLFGGGGDDVLFGGDGNDLLLGDDFAFTVNLGPLDNPFVTGPVEFFPSNGFGNDTLDGGEGDDILFGGAGADVLSGGGGTDYLFGDDGAAPEAGGNDMLDGGEGDDHLSGGVGDDLLLGGMGHDFLGGGAGDDRLEGGEGNDVLLAEEGSNILLGGAGNDDLFGGFDDGVDLFDGGPGADVLRGGAGVCNYVFGRGYGQDRVINEDFGGADSVQMTADVAPNDVTVGRNGDNLVLSFTGTTDQLTLQDYFRDVFFQVAAITFADGTSWDVETVKDLMLTGHGEPMTLEGFSDRNDRIQGSSGDEVLAGLAGDDRLEGGAARDVLYGGSGSDTYVFTRGAGQDTLFDRSGAMDTVVLGAGLTPGDVTVLRSGYHLQLDIRDSSGAAGTSDRLTLAYFFLDPALQVEQVRFEDGTVWDAAQLQALAQPAPPGAEGSVPLFGFAPSGPAGGDGGSPPGGDTGGNVPPPSGGPTTLTGGVGDDTYPFDRGDGQVTIMDQDATPGNLDAIQMGGTIVPSDVTVTRSGEDLVLSLVGTADQLTVQSFFVDPSFQVELVEFGDGTVWDVPTLLDHLPQTLVGTDGVDTLYGGAGADTLDGRGGNDNLYGYDGNDTYLFGRGSGQDTLLDFDPAPGNLDTIQMGADVLPSDLSVTRNGEDLVLSINATTDQLTLQSFFADPGFEIEQVVFADGTRWDTTFLRDKTLHPVTGGPGNDTLRGLNVGRHELHDLLDGGDGHDTLLGDGSIIDPPGDDTLRGGAGNDRLFGVGGNDLLEGGLGDDLLHGDSFLNSAGFLIENLRTPGPDMLLGGEGNDSLFGEGRDDLLDGAAGNDFMDGGEGDDRLFGGEGADRLSGSDGDDLLDGGPGNDSLGGGRGKNTYLFGRGSGQDTISEFDVRPADLNVVEMGPEVRPADVAVTRTGDPTRSEMGLIDLVFRINGTSDQLTVSGFFIGAFKQIQEVRFADGTVWDVDTLKDMTKTIVGTADGDVLKVPDFAPTGALFAEPDEFREMLFGLEGDDTLDGGGGADLLLGGPGNDTYVVDSEFDEVIDAPGEGTDTVQTRVNYTLLDNLENLTLKDTFSGFSSEPDLERSAIVGIGNALDNVLMGNNADNVLDGGGGDDILIGGIAGFQGEGGVVPGSGNDILIGGEGSDTLDGVDGDDTLIGGPGNDTLIGGMGNDTYRFDPGDGVDTIEDTTDDAGNAVVFGDDITSDSLSLGLGSLLIRYGNQGDAIHIENFDPSDALGPHAVDTFQFADGTVLSYSDLIGRGFDLTGTADDDFIAGTNVVDRVSGLAGHDTLVGAQGDDILTGGAGNDTYLVNLSDGLDTIHDTALPGEGNRIQFGDGIAQTDLTFTQDRAAHTLTIAYDGTGDTVQLAGFDPNNVNGTLVVSTLSFSDGSTVNLLDLLGPTVTNGDDMLTFGPGDDTVDALGGNDTVSTDGGNDTLTGGPGNDILDGGPGNDTYVYNLGDGLDQLTDPSGVDTVSFGAGISFDTVVARLTAAAGLTTAHLRLLDTGGSELLDQGLDILLTAGGASPIESFAFANGTLFSLADLEIQTVVTNGTTHDDVIRTGRHDDVINTFEGQDSVFAGSGNDTVSAGHGGDQVYGEGGNDALYGGKGKDLLDGGWGDDLLNGGNGKDRLDGGAGHDTLLGGDGEDTIQGGPGDDVLDTGEEEDTILFGRGDGHDTLVGRSNNHDDEIEFGPGIAIEHVWFQRNGNDLVVSVLGQSGPADQLAIADWYADKKNHVEEFETANGDELDEKQVEQLRQAMAAFAPPALSAEMTLPSNIQQQLAAALAAAWEHGDS